MNHPQNTNNNLKYKDMYSKYRLFYVLQLTNHVTIFILA